MNIEPFITFIVERRRIFERRRDGLNPPFTQDPILQKFRFCNINREDDKVTKWISGNWRKPNEFEPKLAFAMCVARIFNRIEILQAIGFPIPWRPEWVRGICLAIKDSGSAVFGNAYLLSTNGLKINKIDFSIDQILTPAWRKSKNLIYKEGDSLESFCEKLMRFKGFATFKAAQVIADMKYVKSWDKAPDWFSFAASGPGSKRGLNRIFGVDYKDSISEDEWKKNLLILQEKVNRILPEYKIEPLHAQDLQNCCCEFDKYERARLGQGRPKQIFRPEIKQNKEQELL